MAQSTKTKKGSFNRVKVKQSRGPNVLVRLYLITYNLISAFLWGYVLYSTIMSLVQNKGNWKLTYENAGKDLPFVQSLAILEILHSLLGFVRSPLFTTVMQVFSRLLLAVGILYFFPIPEVTQHWALTTMTLAWSITEVIRYLFYFFGLIGYTPSIIEWCRYTLFFVLYPVGASSEIAVAYQALPAIKLISREIFYTLSAILLLYPLGFIQLYSYMIKQRNKYLKSDKMN